MVYQDTNTQLFKQLYHTKQPQMLRLFFYIHKKDYSFHSLFLKNMLLLGVT